MEKRFHNYLYNNRSIPEIGTIAKLDGKVSSDTTVDKIIEIFKSDIHLSGLAIVDDDIPKGIIMRHKLEFVLNRQFGELIFSNRPVELIMDKKPLIVNDKLSLIEVSQLATSRSDGQIYDLILVVDDNLKYKGRVSVRYLLEKTTEIQLQLATSANPLTGLPGTNVLNEEIKYRIIESKPFAVLYLDIDNFKSYNDKYGFNKGDEIILFTASVISDSIKELGNNDDLVCHIGGDDFVVITTPHRTDKICEEIIHKFDTKIQFYYSPEDRSKKYIISVDRQGNIVSFPIMSISIAVVENEDGKIKNHIEIFEITTEIKKEAKKISGSVYLKDKRIDFNFKSFHKEEVRL